jgi:hypothetical protein
LIRFAVDAVTPIFVSVLISTFFEDPNVFRSATQLIAAMSAAFAVVGTYFGIKAGLDGQGRVNDARDRERE